MRYRTILFDLDGTLIDSIELMAAAFGESHARRILKVRQHVHEFRSRAKAGIDLFGQQSIFVDRNGDVLRAIHVECL